MQISSELKVNASNQQILNNYLLLPEIDNRPYTTQYKRLQTPYILYRIQTASQKKNQQKIDTQQKLQSLRNGCLSLSPKKEQEIEKENYISKFVSIQTMGVQISPRVQASDSKIEQLQNEMNSFKKQVNISEKEIEKQEANFVYKQNFTNSLKM